MAGKFILKVDDIKRGESRGVNLVAGTGIALNVTEVEGDHVIAEVEIENTGGVGGGVDIPSSVAYYSRLNAAGLADGMYRWNSGAFTSVTTLAVNGEFYFFQWDGSDQLKEFDAGGFLDANPYASTFWSGTFPAKTTLVLDKGLYTWKFTATLDAAVNPDTYMEFFPEYAEDPSGFGGTAFQNTALNFGWDNSVQTLDTGVNPRTLGNAGPLIIPIDNVRIAPAILTNAGSANNGGIEFIELLIIKWATGA